MNRWKTYSIAISLLIVSIGFSFLIFFFRSKVSYGNYIDPIYHLWLFGPTIASLIFLWIGKEKILQTVALRKLQNYSAVAVPIVLIFSAAIFSIVIQYHFGFIRLEYNEGFFYLFGANFSPLSGSFVWLVLLLIHAGFAEEFAWRGYLYSRVKHLPWLEQILLINTIWAIWHFPFMPFHRPQQFILFWVQCLELGTVLVYARFKAKSSIATMILHPVTVFLISVVSLPYFSVVNSEWAGWPNYTIAALFLPVAIYYYIKGSQETKTIDAA